MTKKVAATTRLGRRSFIRKSEGSVTLRTTEELADFCGVPRNFIFVENFKDELTDKIIELVKKQKITHAALAEKVETSRPKITMILNNRSLGISTDLLVRVLGALGCQAHLTAKKVDGKKVDGKKVLSKKIRNRD